MKSCIRFLLIGAIAGCGSDTTTQHGEQDLVFVFPNFDFSTTGGDDGGQQMTNDCQQFDPKGGQNCQEKQFGPDNGFPFPLSTDMPKDPNESDNGVVRDKNGYLGLSQTMAAFDYIWPANSENWQRGTLSKFDAKTIREIARYETVTCNSLAKGNQSGACDGKGNGCCAKDSYPQWQWRKNNKMGQDPGYQQIQIQSNNASRTAVDSNGDVWVSNRAFGGQSSVTKIANDPTECIDRNGNGKIDTSKDTNGDGVIDTDCNNNNVPDDIADVKQTPCANGMPQEFYGLDDECILFTTNTGPSDKWGRPLSLGPGANDFGPSDAWPGTYMDGSFFRVDGTTGLVKDQTKCGNQPYGVAIDSSSYAWAPPLGAGQVCVFDTKNAQKNIGLVRNPSFGAMNGYGVSLDKDQNVWFGGFGSGNAYRYTPDRSNGFTNLAQGGWVEVKTPGANTIGGGFQTHRGVAVDLRQMNTYWAWLASDSGWIVRIPASTIPAQKPMMDTTVDGSAYQAVRVAGSLTIGAGVDRDQNIWGVSYSGSVATRIKVDVNGNMTMPDINSPPMGNNKCPAGDRCPYQDTQQSNPSPYTYSDFTGFGLRNFTRPKGFWSYVQKGCDDGIGGTDTKWMAVTFDADVPLNTMLTVKARSGNTSMPDNSWGAWTPNYNMTPADLLNGMPLNPNLMKDGFLQVEFDFQTNVQNASPKLKDFAILFECNTVPG